MMMVGAGATTHLVQCKLDTTWGIIKLTKWWIAVALALKNAAELAALLADLSAIQAMDDRQRLEHNDCSICSCCLQSESLIRVSWTCQPNQQRNEIAALLMSFAYSCWQYTQHWIKRRRNPSYASWRRRLTWWHKDVPSLAPIA
jgi:hypothetical protein